jgi:hypothetical protein
VKRGEVQDNYAVRFSEAIEDLLSKRADIHADIARLCHLFSHAVTLLVPQPATPVYMRIPQH